VYAGQPQLAQQLEVSVRAQQNNDNAVVFGIAAGRILEQVGCMCAVEGHRVSSGTCNVPSTALRLCLQGGVA
jgi:hypothetical protein